MSSAMDKLMAAVQKAKSGNSGFTDPDADKFWRLQGDKAGNGYAIIRFLPGKTDDSLPFVKIYSHGFKTQAGKWFIDECPTTLDLPCPVCDANGPLWNEGEGSAGRRLVSGVDGKNGRKRKMQYISNVLVVNDPSNPENEGKVFMFKYGSKIFDKVVGALTPEFADEKAINPFDPESGANFKMKMRKTDGQTNYDKSELDKPEAIGDAKKIKAVLGQMHDIDSFIAPDKFKSYDALQKKLDGAMGNTGGVAKPVLTEEDADEEFVTNSAKATKTVAKKVASKKEESAGEDDDLAFFKTLAEED